MNVESINQDYAKMIREEVDSNPALYHLLRECQSAGLNVDWNGELLAKAFCLMLVRHNKNLKEQLLKAHTNSVRPLFITTPESREDFFKRALKDATDPLWKAQSIDASERMKDNPLYRVREPREFKSHEEWARNTRALNKEQIDNGAELIIHPEIDEEVKNILFNHTYPLPEKPIGMGKLTEHHHARIAVRGWEDTKKRFESIKADTIEGDSLYLAKTYESIDDQSDLLKLIWSAEEKRTIDCRFKIEVSPKSKKQIMDIIDKTPTTFSERSVNENVFSGMKIEEYANIDCYFIGIRYDFDL